MAKIDENYHKLLRHIINEGFKYEDPNRKNVFRHQIPHYQFVHDFKDGFPAITTKKLYWKGVVGELLWILRGEQNIKYLVDNDINIWNKDAYNWYKKNTKDPLLNFDKWLENFKYYSETNDHLSLKNINGDIGRGYGAQLRKWTIGCDDFGQQNLTEDGYAHVDQFADLINTLKTNPMVTKKTVTMWNPAEKDQCALTPCHWSFEILVEPLKLEYNKLKCFCGEGFQENCDENKEGFCMEQKYQFTLKFHMASVDTFLGLPFNIASYALLAHIIGKMTNMIPKGIIGDLSNVHIYEPHLDAVKEQLNRDVNKYEDSELMISTLAQTNLNNDNFKHNDVMRHIDNGNIDIKDFTLSNYKSYSRIPAKMLAYNK